MAVAQDTGTRRATTTFLGDTGLWFVPTAEILPDGKISASGYRANFDREQGSTDISHFAVTFGIGVRDRVEFFGSFILDTRIDRDSRPIFSSNGGGVVNEFPLVTRGWSSDSVGDVVVGAKLNLLSEYRNEGAAVAIRGAVKLPTGSTSSGTGTGKADVLVDLVVSKELAERVELAGYVGAIFRGEPSGFSLSNGLRWGVGAGFPTRSPFRLFTELHGEFPFSGDVGSVGLVGDDGSIGPLISSLDNRVDATVGIVYQAAGGFFAGAGLNWAIPHGPRSNFGAPNVTGDSIGFQVRLGYHPGVEKYEEEPPPPPPPPANGPPTVTAACDPCTVEVGENSTVTATGRDPDGDTLTYRWSAPTGRFASSSDRQTVWTAPGQPSPVLVTVAVHDGNGGAASDSVTIQVVESEPQEFVFEDVHFDFDRYTLRPEAARLLDEAVRALTDNPTLRLQIEGHTCNIGTVEYNLALGERRASSVRDYLTGRGIAGTRLETVGYGEERPMHDNSLEETRRLNRRAAMVVRLTR